MNEVVEKAKAAKFVSGKLATTSTKIKNLALDKIGESLKKQENEIIEANKLDLEAGERKGLSQGLLDRLKLDSKRIKEMIDGLQIVKALPDPIGEVLGEWKRPNGLKIKKVRVPLGVVGIIYEARPNVTIDSAALCIKSGNAVVLRGGSDAINSNKILTKIMREAAYLAGIPDGSIQLIEDTSRMAAEDMMGLREYIDVLIPRGGKSLIQTVVSKSRIPTIETGEGNCHAYVEKSADLKMASEIVFNSKVSRPSVCNAIESLLVDEAIAAKFLPMIFKRLKEAGVEIRGDEAARNIDNSIKAATTEDFETEFLALIIAIKVVKNVEEAVEHINQFSTKHSETIITKDKKAMQYFTDNIDSAAVYVNASTRFTDGGEFGFGAEIGISTQKLHARGPMGLPELTSYKYIVNGNGQIRRN